MGVHFERQQRGRKVSMTGHSAVRVTPGYTIIEVMLFFAVTGALMLGVLGSASVGVNTQRYADAVNTFQSIVQQEFTNVTNVVNDRSIQSMCGGANDDEMNRGASPCVILGRLMTIDSDGNMLRSNIIGTEPSAAPATNARELQVVRSYNPRLDVGSQEKDQMNWGTKILRGTGGAASNTAMLIIRSPRSGNLYSYVTQSPTDLVTNVQEMIDSQIDPNQNGRDQTMCIDRSGWVATPMRVVKLAPYTSGPSGVSTVDATGTICD